MSGHGTRFTRSNRHTARLEQPHHAEAFGPAPCERAGRIRCRTWLGMLGLAFAFSAGTTAAEEWGSDRAPVGLGKPEVPLQIEILADQNTIARDTTVSVQVVLTALGELSDIRMRCRASGQAELSDPAEEAWPRLADGEALRFSVPLLVRDVGHSQLTVEVQALEVPANRRFTRRGTFNILLREDGAFAGQQPQRRLRMEAVRHDSQARRLSPEQSQAAIRNLMRIDGQSDQQQLDWKSPDSTDPGLAVVTQVPAAPAELTTTTKEPGLGPAVNLRVRGVVRYQDVNGALHPVYGMGVKIMDDDTGVDETVVGLVTDSNGQYDTGWFSHDDGWGAGRPDLYVRFETRNGAVNVEDDCFGCGSFWYETAVRDEFAGGEIIENLTCANTGTGPSASILTAMTWGAAYIAYLNDGNWLGQVRVDWPADHSRYRCSPGCHIELVEGDRFDWDVINHEYGHYVMDELNIEESPGGDHALCMSKKLGKLDGIRFAWAEGWPTFTAVAGPIHFNLAGLNVPNVGDAFYNDTEDQTLTEDLDGNSKGSPADNPGASGEDNETAVTRALWDLLDTASDSRDSVSFPDVTLFDYAMSTRPIDFTGYWRTIRQQLQEADNLKIGAVLSDHGLAPTPLLPAPNAILSLPLAVFSWEANVGCDPAYAANQFSLVFFYPQTYTRLLTIPNLTGASYTLTQQQFQTLRGYGPQILWAVEGWNTASPATGPYMGEHRSMYIYTPPGNDHCSSAIPVGNGSYSGTLNGADPDGVSSCTGLSAPPAVWYSYQASCSGLLTVHTCGTTAISPILTVYSGCPGLLANQLACSLPCQLQCPPPYCQALVTVPVIQGQDYLVAVASAQGQMGDFVVTFNCGAMGDACEQALPVGVPSSTLGITTGSSPDYAPTCDGVDDDSPGVWYTLIGNGRLLTASTCNSVTSYNTRLSVYCGGCGGRECIAASDDSCDQRSQVSWCAAPGTIYHVLVHGASGATGPFRLEVSEGETCPMFISCAPGNDGCEQAEGLTTGSYMADNTGADSSASVACALSSHDLWYRFIAVCNGYLTVSTCEAGGTVEDTVLTVFDGCGGRELACSDDVAACGRRSRVVVPVRSDQEVLIRAASFGLSGAQGTFPLRLDFNPAPMDVPPPGFYAVASSGTWVNRLLRLDADHNAVVDVGPVAPSMSTVFAMAYDSNMGALLVVEAGAGDLYEIDSRTGAAMRRGSTNLEGINGLAFDPQANRLYAVTGTDLYVLNAATGAAQLIGATGFGGLDSLAYDGSEHLLYATDTSNQLISIDPLTGAGLLRFSLWGVHRIAGLEYDSNSGQLYGLDVAGTLSSLVVIDRSIAWVSRVGTTLPGEIWAYGLALVPGLPPATVGEPYLAAIPVAGSCPRFWFNDFTGLPAGLSAAQNGFISGTPVEGGEHTLTFTVDDMDLSTPYIDAALPLRVAPPNDLCTRAVEVSEGTWRISNRGANTDGPDEGAACDFSGDTQIGSDIWYRYLASCTGTVTVSTCGSGYNSKLAVYQGYDCPPTSRPRACNDDSRCGLAARVDFPTVAGEYYLIRIGGYQAAQGDGSLAISCAGAVRGACCATSAGGEDGQPGVMFCSLQTSAECLNLAGAYHGDGSACGQDPDADGVAEPCDLCPNDPRKAAPGVCGCDAPDIDWDFDLVMDCVDSCPYTIPGIAVDAQGCPPLIPGDLDRDGDVDQRDVTAFSSCSALSGTGVWLLPGCEAADLDGDEDADQVDFGILQRCYSGEDHAGDPSCGGG